MRPRSLRARLLIGSIIPIVLLVLVALSAYAAFTISLQTADEVRRSEQSISDENLLLRQAIDAESGLRGYIVTGDETFLEPFDTARGSFQSTAAQIKATIAGLPPVARTPAGASTADQIAFVDRALAQFTDWQQNVGDHEIGLIRAGHLQDAQAFVATGAGKTRMDTLRVTIAGLVSATETTRDLRSARHDRAADVSRIIVVGGLIIGVAVLVFVLRFVFTRTSRRLRAIASASTAMADGDLTKRLDESGETELAATAHAFNKMATRIEELVVQERDRAAALEDAVHELETFSYSVSHDLRAPLRSFDGYSAILLEEHSDRLDEEARGLLDRMRNASQRMGQLIDDLLALSRIGRMEIQREQVDVSALAGTVVETLRAGDPDRKVEVDIEPGIVAAADRRLVRLVLENLLGNAWKFTARSADARIEVSREPASAIDAAGGIVVRDNGVGFDMTFADKLFGPFQRLHAASDFPGTGIGLATVQRILHRHGGWIRVSAALDEGATFTFSFSGRVMAEPASEGPAPQTAHRPTGDVQVVTRSDAWTT